jgi:hypothetical protein
MSYDFAEWRVVANVVANPNNFGRAGGVSS